MLSCRPVATRAIETALIVSLTHPDARAMRAGMAAAARQGADMVECRLDLLERPDPALLPALLKDPPLPVIVTCRPARQGGRFSGDEARRLALLAEAARLGAAYIDVEEDVPPARRPPGRLILSHHDFASRPRELDRLLARLTSAGADVVKVAFAASGPEDALAACRILREAKKPTIALAMGETGLASRILARKFGAFGTYAALASGAEAAPGQLSITEMKRLYRWEAIGPETAVYGVVGCPVAHSMSPAIHNAAFAAAGIDAVYVPLRVEPGADNFRRFLEAVLDAPWSGLRGLSVTIPHKENALARVGAGNVDELSRRIGAINTIRLGSDGTLRGWNTDYAAATDALCEAMGISREGLAGRKAAVLGAGGAARAIVAALAHYGAEVTIYNRTFARAEKLAAEFGAAARPLDALEDLAAEIVINCTSVGMHPRVEESPLPERLLRRVPVVFDTVYNPPQTRLLRQAGEAGCLCVAGTEMFLRQALMQFGLWTSRPAPREVMRRVLMERLSESKS